jgi:hypothetical protein
MGEERSRVRMERSLPREHEGAGEFAETRDPANRPVEAQFGDTFPRANEERAPWGSMVLA